MYKTKKVINLVIRDDKNKIVSHYHVSRGKANDLLEIEKAVIEHEHKIDQLLGLEHKNLHTELQVLTVRA